MGFSWIFPQKNDPAIGVPPVLEPSFDGGCYCGCRGGAAAGYAWESDPQGRNPAPPGW